MRFPLSSLPKLESFLMTLGMGATGISLLQDFGIRTPELRHYIDYWKNLNLKDMDTEMAMRPNQVYRVFVDFMKNANAAAKDQIAYLEVENPSPERLIEAQRTLNTFYNSAYQMYTVMKSGNTQIVSSTPSISA